MEASKEHRPRIFIDADVLFAGAASPAEHSASLVILRMAEITLIEAICSEQVIREVERNMQTKMVKALPAFQLLTSRCLRIISDPTLDEIKAIGAVANEKDLPILTAALREKCTFLTTYNLRHYQLGLPGITVLKPGDLVLRVHYLLAQLKSN
jgi:hypothetical protein